MNEFTKEDLMKLKCGLEHLPNSLVMGKLYWDDCQKIILKIQSMIDNYCDHEQPLKEMSADEHYI